MFSRELQEVDLFDQGLLSDTMDQWQNFWMSPAIMAVIVLVIFGALFWDKTEELQSNED